MPRSKVILVANRIDSLAFDPNCDYIGIDKGALYCMCHQIPLVRAIGDFDSISEADAQALNKYCEVEKLHPIKDDSDSEHALYYAWKQGYEDITIMGVCGGRLDHFYAVLELLMYGDIDFKIVDRQNTIYRCRKGCYEISKRSRYISFFALRPMHMTVSGVKYPLEHALISSKDASYLLSNEILHETAYLEIDDDLIIMECDDA